jgi:hypothetical protein
MLITCVQGSRDKIVFEHANHEINVEYVRATVVMRIRGVKVMLVF